MPNVVGIRFKNCGKIYDFEIDALEVGKGDLVVVESEFGLSIGNVVTAPHAVEHAEKELKKVLRRASEEDHRQKQDNESFEKEARSFCAERIMARGIPMKLVCTEVTLDKKRIVFYFTADGRIDFRELVKDLAAKFKKRIEMRQIGVRDKAKLIGGLGLCGKDLCCRVFLTSFEPISIKMAKKQELVLNTGKLSGVCGRLMCCLGYEYDEAEPGASADEATVPAGEEEVTAEIMTEEPESRSEEILCPVPVSTGGAAEKAQTAPDAQAAKPDDQQAQDQPKKNKRRRRRRKGWYHKKSE